MSIESWLDQYGYWAVFIGVFFEGPITLTTAGFLAHQGYLNILGVVITAFAAAFMVVELMFLVGMVAGRYLLRKWPKWRKHHERFSALLDRYKGFFLLAFRFVYGAQTIAPIVMGTARIRPGYFSAMNAAGAVIWVVVLVVIGYFFGHAFERLIEDVKRYEKPISLVLVALVLAYYLARRFLWRRISAAKNNSSAA